VLTLSVLQVVENVFLVRTPADDPLQTAGAVCALAETWKVSKAAISWCPVLSVFEIVQDVLLVEHVVLTDLFFELLGGLGADELLDLGELRIADVRG